MLRLIIKSIETGIMHEQRWSHTGVHVHLHTHIQKQRDHVPSVERIWYLPKKVILSVNTTQSMASATSQAPAYMWKKKEIK